MKICIITNLYKPFNRGGAERIAELQFEAFQKKGNEVFLISSKPYFKTKPQNAIVKYYLNSIYYNLSLMPKVLRFFWHILDVFNIYRALRIYFILKKEAPDLVFSHNLKGLSYLIPFFIKKTGIKNIHIIHDLQLLHPSGLLYKNNMDVLNNPFLGAYAFLCRKLFSFPDTIVSPSAWLLAFYKKRGFWHDSKTGVINNPFPYFLVKEESKSVTNQFYNFLYVGLIEKQKGIEILLASFEYLDKILPGKCTLSIVGEGSLLESVKNKYSKNSNIHIFGKLNSEEVYEIMRKSDCMIVPSLCLENSPTVIYEAYSAGLHIIASNLGGIPELISKFDGELFEAGDSENLSAKMMSAAKEKKRPQIKNFEALGNDFSVDNYLKKILSI